MTNRDATPNARFAAGSRVIVGRDKRLRGVLETYEFPPEGGLAFVQCDNGLGYWCQQYDLEIDHGQPDLRSE